MGLPAPEDLRQEPQRRRSSGVAGSRTSTAKRAGHQKPDGMLGEQPRVVEVERYEQRTISRDDCVDVHGIQTRRGSLCADAARCCAARKGSATRAARRKARGRRPPCRTGSLRSRTPRAPRTCGGRRPTTRRQPRALERGPSRSSTGRWAYSISPPRSRALVRPVSSRRRASCPGGRSAPSRRRGRRRRRTAQADGRRSRPQRACHCSRAPAMSQSTCAIARL